MSTGKLRNSISYSIEFRCSKLEVNVWLDENSPLLNYEVTCNWLETGKPQKSVPQLGFYLPLGFECSTYRYDVPFGVEERNGMDIDVPANSWAASKRCGEGKKDIFLVTDSKYGFRSFDNSMSITLIRSSYDPDPYPELGVHRFKFAIGVVDSASTNKDMIELAYNYNHGISVVSGKAHNGSLALTNGFVRVEEGSIAVSAIKMPEEGAGNKIIIRCYETDGNRTLGALKLFKKPKKAYFVDINELPVSGSDLSIQVENDTVRFDVIPYSIASLMVEMD
jgi:alpha-mannosidase